MSSLEARLSALEIQLGVRAAKDAQAEADWNQRLTDLQQHVHRHTTPEMLTLHQETQKLLKELDPSIAAGLTHQQQPLLYKRQEVLAAAPTLSSDMAVLAEMLHLLMVDAPAANGNNAPQLRLEDITQSPILLTGQSLTPDQEKRLDSLKAKLHHAHQRTQVLSAKLVRMMETYHAVMSAASEKCVLADEVLKAKGK